MAVLRELHADVIALQEVDRRFGERESVLPKALLDETPWRAAPVARRTRSIGWHGNALLVRKDIAIEHAEAVNLPTLEPRGAVRADLLVEGRRVRVLGMHLDLSGLLRRDQIRAIGAPSLATLSTPRATVLPMSCSLRSMKTFLPDFASCCASGRPPA